MTPTLFGRWQVRIVLLSTVGVFLTIPFALFGGPSYFLVLLYVIIFGLLWDCIYQLIQKMRWDRDWPGVLQLIAAIWEVFFILFWGILTGLPGVPRSGFNPIAFIFHYSSIWIAVYIAAHSFWRIFFPHSRFQGGQFWR
jgi:hypothetical protein